MPFPTPGNLPDPRIKSTSLASPALAGRFFTTVPPGKLILSKKATGHQKEKNKKKESQLRLTVYANLFLGGPQTEV